MLLPLIRISSSNLRLKEVARGRGSSYWAPELKAVVPRRPPLEGGSSSPFKRSFSPATNKESQKRGGATSNP